MRWGGVFMWSAMFKSGQIANKSPPVGLWVEEWSFFTMFS